MKKTKNMTLLLAILMAVLVGGCVPTQPKPSELAMASIVAQQEMAKAQQAQAETDQAAFDLLTFVAAQQNELAMEIAQTNSYVTKETTDALLALALEEHQARVEWREYWQTIGYVILAITFITLFILLLITCEDPGWLPRRLGKRTVTYRVRGQDDPS